MGSLDISEIEITSDILDPSGAKYSLPSFIDVGFLLQIKSFK
jgi:hypothetical protein